MKLRLPVRPTRLAATHIRRENQWWRRNRSAAPTLFRDEVRKAFALISSYPEIGGPTEDVDLHGVRRVLLSATHHYLYYRVNEDKSAVDVLAVWSTDRGVAPPI